MNYVYLYLKNENKMDIEPRFEHFCRICTVEQEVGIMIFGEEGEKMMLPEKITQYLHVEIASDDRLPKMICISCCTRLDGFRLFAEMARLSQIKLNEHVVIMENKFPDKEIDDKNMSRLPVIMHNGNYVIVKKEEPTEENNSSHLEADSDVTEMEVNLDPMMFLDCDTEDSRTNDTSNCSDSSAKDYSYNNFHDAIRHNGGNQGNSLTIELVQKEVTIKEEFEKVPKTLPDLKPIKFAKKSNGADTKPFICSLCPRSFLSSIALQNHSWLHLKSKVRDSIYERVSCPICQKEISTKGNLKVHMDTHRPKGKYGCEICGRVFKTNSNLVRHKEYHGGEVHSCSVCGRVYPTNSTLRAHSITHSDARPHNCPLCNKTFKRNQDLKFHINQHTGARPYCCPYCTKAFASSGNCFSHRKRMHPMEVERDREKRVN